MSPFRKGHLGINPQYLRIYLQPKGWGNYLFIRVLIKFTYPVIYGGSLGNNDPSWGFPARPAGGNPFLEWTLLWNIILSIHCYYNEIYQNNFSDELFRLTL